MLLILHVLCIVLQPLIEMYRMERTFFAGQLALRIMMVVSRTWFFFFGMMFVFATVLDFRRRYTNGKRLTNLITHVPVKAVCAAPLQWSAPVVDVAIPKNAHAFYALRTIVHDLGRRYNVSNWCECFMMSPCVFVALQLT